jgi:hypothetical protein
MKQMICLAGFFAAALVHQAAAQTPIGWTEFRRGENPFFSLIAHEGRFIGVGSDGMIASSQDGAAWSQHASGTGADLNKVVEGGGRFAAFGDSGAIIVSTGGIAWTRRTSGYAKPIHSAAFGNGTFAALGSDGTLLTSADGTVWTLKPSISTLKLNTISFGDGRFVLAGEKGALYESPDAAAWIDRTKGTASIVAIVRGDSVFAAMTDQWDFLYSKDGLTWSPATTPSVSRPFGLTYADKRFLAMGESGALYTSAEGRAWVSDTLGNKETMYCVTASEGRILASGTTLSFSPDGKTWYKRKFEGTSSLRGAAYGNGRFVAAGEWSTMLQSGDGAFWTTPAVPGSGFFNEVIYALGMFIAVAQDGRISTSADGDRWTNIKTATGDDFTDVAYGGAGLVAIAYNYPFPSATTVYGSKDGITWTSLLEKSPVVLEEIAFGNGKYVAVGGNGAIRASADGATWTTHDFTARRKYLYSVAYGGGLFAAVGSSGTILTSPDGTTWTNRTTDTTQALYSITHNGRQFVAIGSGSHVRLSTDGIAWTWSKFPVANGNSIHYGGGRHLMTGSFGRVTTSTDSVLVVGVRQASAKRPGSRLEIGRTEGGMLHLTLPAGFDPAATTIRFLDAKGKLRLERIPVRRGTESRLALGGLAPGTYTVEAIDGRSRSAGIFRMR